MNLPALPPAKSHPNPPRDNQGRPLPKLIATQDPHAEKIAVALLAWLKRYAPGLLKTKSR